MKVHCKPKTEKLYRTAIDRHIVPALGTMAVKDVRSKDVIALHDRLRNTPSMANHVVAMLSKMFSLAETWDVVPRGRNPCKAVSHYREQPRERFLTPEESRSVGAALREAEAGGWMWRPTIAAIRLLMLTGCRKSEILTLRWDDVDRTTGEYRLRDGKRGPRMVPLTTPVLKVLDGIERVEGTHHCRREQRSAEPQCRMHRQRCAAMAHRGRIDGSGGERRGIGLDCGRVDQTQDGHRGEGLAPPLRGVHRQPGQAPGSPPHRCPRRHRPPAGTVSPPGRARRARGERVRAGVARLDRAAAISEASSVCARQNHAGRP